MLAQLLTEYGGTDRFQLADVPTPEPGPGELLIKIAVIGLNQIEVKIRRGWMQDQIPINFPAILGNEVAGTVEAVGEGVADWSRGDRVVGLVGSGAYCQFATARADQVTRVPDTLSLTNAATLPTAAETARRVIALLAPTTGETVVVNGAAGAVGTVAVQLLVQAGVRVVATAGEDNQAYLRDLGAEPTTYGDGVVERIRTVADQGVDAVFDAAGHGFLPDAITLLGGTTRLVTIADMAAADLGVTFSAGTADSITSADFEPMVDMAGSGGLATAVARTFTLTDLAKASQFSEEGHVRGKIVVLVDA